MKSIFTAAKCLFPALIILFLFSSCEKDRISGNGDIVSETRNVSGFTGVRSSGSNKVNISYGPEFKVVLKGSSNLIPYFETAVRNNTLIVNYENVNVRHNDIEVFVTMPKVSHASVSGSGDIELSGNFEETDLFDVSISGSANITVEDPFVCRNVAATISGSGNANLLPVKAENGDVTISGSGNAKVDVQENLEVRISGSGNVFYKGSPRIDSSVSGSGKVKHL